jgi:uncharacterized membrane-anchored protein YjiN (DUF445 family)
MGIFLVGQVAYGFSPGDAQQRETTVGIADTPAVGRGLTQLDIETLERVSAQAMQWALTDTAAELAKVTDTSAITRVVAELQANAVDRALVAKLIKRMERHRWRNYSNHYARACVPIDKIYRPGWKGKMCEG